MPGRTCSKTERRRTESRVPDGMLPSKTAASVGADIHIDDFAPISAWRIFS